MGITPQQVKPELAVPGIVGKRVRPVDQPALLITLYYPHLSKKVIDIDKVLHSSRLNVGEQCQQPPFTCPGMSNAQSLCDGLPARGRHGELVSSTWSAFNDVTRP